MNKQVFIRVLAIIILALPINVTSSFCQAKYQRIYFEATPLQVKEILQMGVAVDHLMKSGNGFQTEISSSEVQTIQKAGCFVKILIDDLNAYFYSQFKNYSPSTTRDAPVNFHLGSLGGNLTLQECWNELDSMRLKYPSLITAKQPIGYSIENRPLYMVKISDNADTDEEETEIEFDAMHHAREPVSMMQLIYYMWHLLESYNVDSFATYLVNNREIYFIPCVNPDGYYYNQSIEPNGGGMWRKNRRLNDDGSYGVDLNRNYGYQWGYDDFGSSSYPSDDTYRGTSPFSEPETQALRDFTEEHQFATSISCHTFGNDLIYPFGYSLTPCPEEDWFSTYASLCVTNSGYLTGNVYQTLGYFANGTTTDWMYGEQATKNKVYGYSPETGYSFWPYQGDIEPMCENILEQNLFLTWIPDAYMISTATTDNFTYNLNIPVSVEVTNIGLSSGGPVTISIQVPSSYAMDNTDTVILNSLLPGETTTATLHFELYPSTPSGQLITVNVNTKFALFQQQAVLGLNYFSPVGAAAISELNNSFELYPNPTDGIVNFKSKNILDEGTLYIFDVTGKKLRVQSVYAGEPILLNGLTSGIYFYQVETKNALTTVRKLVVQ